MKPPRHPVVVTPKTLTIRTGQIALSMMRTVTFMARYTIRGMSTQQSQHGGRSTAVVAQRYSWLGIIAWSLSSGKTSNLLSP